MNVSTFINEEAITSKSLRKTLLHQMYKIKTTTLLVGIIDNRGVLSNLALLTPQQKQNMWLLVKHPKRLYGLENS